MIHEKASCHCGNICVKIFLSNPIDEFFPRLCDCDFCTKHAASYISDPDGRLNISINKSDHVINYKQGSGMASFLICGKCGVLVAVTFLKESQLIGALNSKTLIKQDGLKPNRIVSPKILSDEEKTDRWMAVWFRNVSIVTGID